MTTSTCRVCEQVKPIEDFEKHKKCKGGYTSRCTDCRNAYLRSYYQANKGRVAQIQKKSRAKRLAEGKDVNKPSREYSKRNPQYKRFYSRQRESRLKVATPPWLTDCQKKDMRSLYFLRDKMSETFGCEYHVDHIVPLRGKNVCGLNVPWNLQILEKSLNLSKRNKYN